MVGFGGDLNEDVVVEGLDGGEDADDLLEILVLAVVEVASGIGDGVLVGYLVAVVEVGEDALGYSTISMSRSGMLAKWASDESSVAPASTAQAAIHMSFCGIGVPFAFRTLKIRA